MLPLGSLMSVAQLDHAVAEGVAPQRTIEGGGSLFKPISHVGPMLGLTLAGRRNALDCKAQIFCGWLPFQAFGFANRRLAHYRS